MVTPQQSKVSKKDIESIYPLSPMQQGMLFHSLYNPESKTYLSQIQITLQGNLDINVFQQSWQKVVDRHSILRTCFAWKKTKQPLQVVRKNVTLPWFNYDWRAHSPAEKETKFQELLTSDKEQYFELDKVPLFRCHLIQVEDQKYEFIHTGHHILLDGWATAILLKEVFEFYAGLINHRPINLPTPRPYQDYINWVQQQDQTEAERFWRKNLQGFTSPTPLVVDKPLNPLVTQSKNYLHQKSKLSPEITSRLKLLAQEYRLTLSTLIQGAWALLLHHYSSESDIVFGATVSGRPPNFTGIESMVGMFLNTLPVRIQIEAQLELLTWFQQLQQEHLEREQYSYSSLIDIQKWSEIPSPHSVFESFVVFENSPFSENDSENLGGLQVGEMQDYGNADYPLTVIVTPGEALSIKIIYPQERFENDTIERMLGHFKTLLEGIAINPHRRIQDLPLLTEAERKLLLIEWNQTAPQKPLKQCVHQLFEQQTLKTPSAIAVVFQEQQLTYQELNEAANQLAHYLRSLRVKADCLVGLCVERSLEMVIGILGILKAGAAYLPLDPKYPMERLSFMVKDAQTSVLLSQEKLVEKLPEYQTKRVYLDRDWPNIAEFSRENLNLEVQPHNLGYVIYTSGSTGQPKGVMMGQLALCNLILWQLQNTTLTNQAKTLQFAPISFDVSFQEIFATLSAGGRLVLITEELRRDTSALLDFLEKQAIERLFLPFVALQQLAEVSVSRKFWVSSLREVITAGEQLQITPAIAAWFRGLEHCTLHNHYGPSESHVVTSFTLTNPVENWPLLPPIGRAIANVQIYILDAFLQPVPVRVSGELYVGGVGVARGYLNRPELTAERFILNPFSDNSLLYKTGDLARYLPNGDIEYLGRIDDVVKVRGYRIELGEVEAILNQHPQIAQAVATVQGETAREKYLASYFIPRHGETVNIVELRHFLEKWLPDYMIPSAFVPMESFLLNPNGKVDRKALPLPNKNLWSFSENYVAPRSAIEEVMAEIWAEILEVEKVGIDNDFFVLGGHSLKAIQLISKIRQTLEIEISVRQLFNNSTISQLVKVMSELVGDEELLNKIAVTFQEISKLSPEEVQFLLSQG